MSSTRYSSSGSRQHGLASDPVYVAAQGIQGTIATKKAGILTSARARSLVFFLQALSLPELAGRPNPGGLSRWVREFINEFPERIGRPAMHECGIKPGQSYNVEQVRRIRTELGSVAPRIEEEFPLAGDTVFDLDYEERPIKGGRSSYPAEAFVEKCRRIAESRLENYLITLCTDPGQLIIAPGEDKTSALVSREEILQQWPEAESSAVAGSVPYFRDIIGSLFEFQQRLQDRNAADFAKTSIAKQVFEALDAGLRLRRIVMVNGMEGIGKSEAARAWCAQHLGEARYVDLTGINNKTSFFRSISRALGLPSGESLNTAALQTRVEAMLQRSGLMLVIDEAHYLRPQSERSEAPPELVNWIDTALVNRGVPVGLVTTPQFVVSVQRVERKTGWNSGQFRRRIKRVAALPSRPTQEDLELIARRLLPKAAGSVIKLLVGYAGSQQCHHLDAITDAVKEAAEIARESGRDTVTFADVESAVTGVLSETALAKNEIFTQRKQPTRGKGARQAGVADVLNEPCKGVSTPFRDTISAGKPARTSAAVMPAIERGELAEV